MRALRGGSGRDRCDVRIGDASLDIGAGLKTQQVLGD
jgi:hypothetical protein